MTESQSRFMVKVLLSVGSMLIISAITATLTVHLYNSTHPIKTGKPSYCHSLEEDEPPYDCDYLNNEWHTR